MSSLTSDDVKAEARRLGFALAGVATAERFVEAEERAIAWLREQRHGEMAWFDEARTRRSCRPDELLPGARSLISVGAVYSRGHEEAPPPLHGRVARYARSRDYHDVLKERLWQLVAFLRQRAGADVSVRLFVDTGPLLDREAAVRAGLGFYGKNTCVLTPVGGSYALLGTILTDLPLEPDHPSPRDCGSCRLCLEACPTGALAEPYQLDARLCISYLTIELRGPIPPELRPRLGAHLFGCDVCQEVCPWNHGRGSIPWPEFTPDSAPGNETAESSTRATSTYGSRPGADLELTQLLVLDDEGFRRRFKGSPLKRAKRRGLLRNAAIVLGNSGNRRAVPALAQALLGDPEGLVRQHAAWALRRLGGLKAESALADAREREHDPDVRAELDLSA